MKRVVGRSMFVSEGETGMAVRMVGFSGIQVGREEYGRRVDSI